MVGYACAIGFAIVNACGAVVVNAKLRGESALFMTFGAMVLGIVAALIFLAAQGQLAAAFAYLARGPRAPARKPRRASRKAPLDARRGTALTTIGPPST